MVYRNPPGIKRDPVRRWHQPDRIFFGHGACHILAGVYLDTAPINGFRAERIVPSGDVPGNHVFVTDGTVAFDHRGYSLRDALLSHHWKIWDIQHPGWQGEVLTVDFPLLDTEALNRRKMLGPDQYLHDPIPRAARFLSRIDHRIAYAKALNSRSGSRR